MWARGRAGQPVWAAAGLTGHSGSQPRHFRAGFGSAAKKYQVGACGQLQINGGENSPKLHFSLPGKE